MTDNLQRPISTSLWAQTTRLVARMEIFQPRYARVALTMVSFYECIDDSFVCKSSNLIDSWIQLPQRERKQKYECSCHLSLSISLWHCKRH